MFCSKCGNQVKDDALFCDKCGYKLDGSVPINQSTATYPQQPIYQQTPQIVYVNQPKHSFISDDPEETNRKLAAIIFFIVSGIMMLGAIITLVATKLGIIADMIESDYPHSSIERALQGSFEESKGFIIFFFFAYIAYIIFQSFTLWLQCRKREFAKNRKAVKFNCVSDIVCILLVTLLIGISLSDATHGSTHFSVLYYVIIIAIITFKIIYAVLYSKAADYEEYLSGKERRASSVPSNDWVCVHCGSSNAGNDTFCQKCGKNYTRQGWTCSSCGTFNDKNELSCKGCGKYR